MDVYVERLYAALTDAIRRGRPGAFDAPVTVAEIYQDLVPYRSVRATLGFELNADYEHALLQLLAGLGGLARLEPQEAAAELRSELRSPNPNVGLFRKFAACDVWIAPPPEAEPEAAEEEAFAPEPVEDEAGAPGDEPAAASRMEAGASPPSAPRTEPGSARPEPGASPAVPPRTGSVASPAAAARTAPASPAPPTTAAPDERAAAPLMRDTARRCGFCDAKLPAGRLVRFCPQCGGDQARRPCAVCGETLEATWRFCVSCGAPQEGPTSA